MYRSFPVLSCYIFTLFACATEIVCESIQIYNRHVSGEEVDTYVSLLEYQGTEAIICLGVSQLIILIELSMRISQLALELQVESVPPA